MKVGFGILLLGQLQFAACVSMVQGCMAPWEVELWMADPTLSFTGVAIGHNVASTLFGGTMPLVATFLYYPSVKLVGDEGDGFVSTLLPRLIPGFYVSCLGCLSLFCISHLVRHPHDIRIGDQQLKFIVEKENRKFKQAAAMKKQMRMDVKSELEGKTIARLCIITGALDLSKLTLCVSFF